MTLVFFYSAVFLLYFWQTPLGLTPVLDGAENVRLAEEIYQGNLAREPFYRSMLYPAYLSVFRFLGIAKDELNAIAALSGMFFHLLNSWLIGCLSFIVWKTRKAMLFSVFLYGFYPVALHYAVDPLDITMAITFTLLSLLSFFHSLEKGGSRKFAFLSGICLGVGALLRANILPLAGIWVLCLLSASRRRFGIMALAGLAIPMLIIGFVNLNHAGQFRIMPWQGSFNLFAANGPHANGKFFRQRLMVSDRELGSNPARLESEIIYRKSSEPAGKVVSSKSIDIDKFNRFWRRKTYEYIRENPGAWMTLLLKKIYYLLNNYEQYNNKTFSFHKNLSPILRYNPLGFGLILILAVSVLIAAKRDNYQFLLLQTIVFLSGGILLFYVSGRFRMLLVPPLLVFAAGVVNISIKEWMSWRKIVVLVLSACLSFSTFFQVADTSTWNSDRLLLAHACSRLGMFSDQLHWADQVLKQEPENIQAIRLKLVAFGNLALSGKFTEPDSWNQVAGELEFLIKKGLFYSDTMFLQGCYLQARKGDSAGAVAVWERGLKEASQPDMFLAALIFFGRVEVTSDIIEMSANSPLLSYVLATKGKISAKNAPGFELNAVPVEFLFATGG